MQKIKIRLPATITDFGPGLQSIGLAVSLYVTVEVSRRDDNALNVHFEGVGADHFKSPLRNPVVLGMSRFFQHLEKTVAGIDIRITNQIPLGSGLGAEAAFMVAGVVGANDLMGYPVGREMMMTLAAQFTRSDHAVTALSGGLTTSLLDGDDLYYRSLPVTPFDLVIVAPEQAGYHARPLPESISRRDALHNLARLPLLVDALRSGDIGLLTHVLTDRIQTPNLQGGISGYGHVTEIAKRAGALAVTTCGRGPAVIAITESRHKRIAEDMRLAFESAGVQAQSWILPIDTQGVVISAVQSV